MQQEQTLVYNIVPRAVLENTSIEIMPNCNSITIINIGTTQATVNYFIPLNAGVPGTSNGESFTFGGNRLEIFNGRLDIAFPGTGAGNVVVIQKIYINL